MRSAPVEIFTSVPVPKAIMAFVLPTVLSQLVAVLYNMADTFFIGQLGNADQVAAATVSIPVMQVMVAITNLFGIGGAAAIARAMGVNNRKKAILSASFSIWSAVFFAFLYGIAVYFERSFIFSVIGADEHTSGFCGQYLFWVVTAGSVPTVLNPLFAHLVRAQGFSKEASFGIAFGGILNMFLDPLFIFVFGLEIRGAGMATMLSNLAATVYFLIFIGKIRAESVIRFKPRYFSVRRDIFSDVFLGGLSGAMMTFMAMASNIVLYNLMGTYSNSAIAGMGIAKRIDMVAFALGQGMAQGILPLVAFNFSAKNYLRMKAVIRTSIGYSLLVALFGTVVLYFGAGTVTKLFINEQATVHYGERFLQAISLCCPTLAINFMLIAIFQATNQKLQAMTLTVMRKGAIDIPLMYGLNMVVGVYGIAWATTLADWFAFVVGMLMLFCFYRKNRKIFV